MAEDNPAKLVPAEDAEVARLIRKTGRRARHLYGINTLVFLSFLASMLAYLALAADLLTPAAFWVLYPLLGLSVTSLAGSLWLTSTFFREGKEEMLRIDKRGINSLCQIAIHSVGMRLHPLAIRRILEVLPSMNAADSLRINPASRLFTANFLSKGSTETTLALLKSLEQIGDTWCLSQVNALASLPLRSRYGKRTAEVKEQAARTREFIQQRLDEGKTALTLLRSSSAPADPKSLLRPVMPAPDDAPNHLLRASSSQEKS